MAQEEKIIPERWAGQYENCDWEGSEVHQLIEELGAAESKLARFRTPKVYEGPFYAMVEVPDMCPECDGKSWISHGSKGMCCHICFLIRDLDAAESALTTQADEMKRLREALESKREHTHKWYAGRYGKLHDWARKILPEPWSTQFFSCIANGIYSATEDVGEPYMCALGKVVPSGYFVMDTASEQLLHEQTRRAEDAETALAALSPQEPQDAEKEVGK